MSLRASKLNQYQNLKAALLFASQRRAALQFVLVETRVQMFIQHSLDAEDPWLLQVLDDFVTSPNPDVFGNRRSRWTAAGPGPVALRGGDWASGVWLAPTFKVMTRSLVKTLVWHWNRERLGEWDGHSNVRLLLVDAETRRCWASDVTSQPHGARIIPPNLELSANCLAVFQLRAGDRRGDLLRPPFIRNASLTVTYRH